MIEFPITDFLNAFVNEHRGWAILAFFAVTIFPACIIAAFYKPCWLRRQEAEAKRMRDMAARALNENQEKP